VTKDRLYRKPVSLVMVMWFWDIPLSLPERIPGLYKLSQPGFHSSYAHERGRDTGEHGEEQDDQRGVSQAHAKLQCSQHAGGNTR